MSEVNNTAEGGKEAKPKGDSPVLRGVSRGADGKYHDTVVLWPTGESATAAFKGFAVIEGVKRNVLGFINQTRDNPEKPNAEKRTYVTLSERTEGGLVPLAFGSALNSRNDDEPVFFDTVIFNTKGDGQTFSARLTNAASPELGTALGFKQDRRERPVAQPAVAEEAHEETTAAADRPTA